MNTIPPLPWDLHGPWGSRVGRWLSVDEFHLVVVDHALWNGWRPPPGDRGLIEQFRSEIADQPIAGTGHVRDDLDVEVLTGLAERAAAYLNSLAPEGVRLVFAAGHGLYLLDDDQPDSDASFDTYPARFADAA